MSVRKCSFGLQLRDIIFTQLQNDLAEHTRTFSCLLAIVYQLDDSNHVYTKEQKDIMNTISDEAHSATKVPVCLIEKWKIEEPDFLRTEADVAKLLADTYMDVRAEVYDAFVTKVEQEKCCVKCLKTKAEQKIFKCSGCRSQWARYCGRTCQRNDWAVHKLFCNDLRQHKSTASMVGRFSEPVAVVEKCDA